MIEPLTYIVIRDGRARYFLDPRGQSELFRNLLWGPEALEDWLAAHEEVESDEDVQDCGIGIFVDHDRREVLWMDATDEMQVPKVAACLDRLLRTAWPDYRFENYLPESMDLVIEGESIRLERDTARFTDRMETIDEAIGYDPDDYEDEYDDGDDEDSGDEDASRRPAAERPTEVEDYLDENDRRAWITLIDRHDRVIHRQLPELTIDIFQNYEDILSHIANLPDADVPIEAVVKEGIWFHSEKRQIRLWGNASTRQDLPTVEENYADWDVRWVDDGYNEQAAASGPAGIPMSDTEAIALLLPELLSTERNDFLNVMGAVGQELKRTAIRLTGCLVFLFSLPVLLVGLIAGNLKMAAIIIATMAVMTMIAFKLAEWLFRKRLRSVQSMLPGTQETPEMVKARDTPAVAGPLDKSTRESAIADLLKRSGLPSIEACKSYTTVN